MAKSFWLFHIFFLATAISALGQRQAPKDNYFEVASIRPGSPEAVGCGHYAAPLQLRMENCTLAYLIKSVYGPARPEDLLGLPKWASSERFTIIAKSVAPANELDQWPMLRPLLEDRFQFKYHHEKRQLPVYLFSAATSGIKLHETAPDSCKPFDPQTGPPPPPKPGERDVCGRILNQGLPGGGIRVTGYGVMIAGLVRSLSPYFDHPVVDQTGSTKLFDVDLSFMRSDLPVNPSDDLGLPTVTGALKKIGLDVKSGKGPVEVLVVDRLERPSEN